ncbi:acyl-CoA N-acyltransferase [Pyrenochaeta sp. DS3sAY3a]|nr:acyl-CoA N-acyltransferase [Pyrenochaeta sp. DS3sAY3a]
MEITIRLAKTADLSALAQIEHSSDQLFRQYGKSQISDLPPTTPEEYQSSVDTGRVWIAIPDGPRSNDESGVGVQNTSPAPVAFISSIILKNQPPENNDGENIFKSVFINQVSVDTAYARQGIGKKLIQHVEATAAEDGAQAIDLTTFADVPFNKPYYEKLGFGVLSPEELGRPDARELWRILEQERSDELLGRWERVGMRKSLV